MPGVPRELVEHSLNVRPDAKPVRQPLWHFAEEKRKAIGEEIARLLAAGFIMEVFYPDWLKDTFVLPRIDQVINSTADCDLLSFLDAYSGYH
jgi:hypothetical protein